MQRLANSAWPMIGLFVLLLLSLYLLADFAGNIERFGRLYVPLLLLNALGIVFIAILIGINAWNLVGQFRRRAAGARLTVRLVAMFVVLALVPVTIVYSFSIQFIRSGIDSWFDVEVERALDDALDLSTQALELHARGLKRYTERIVDRLDTARPRAEVREALHDLRVEADASWFALYSEDRRMIATSRRGDRAGLLDERLPADVVERVRAGESYAGLDPERGDQMHVRVVVTVAAHAGNGTDGAAGALADGDTDGAPEDAAGVEDWLMLEALYPVPGEIHALATSVQEAVGTHRELVFLREPLKTSYILTLSLVLLLSVLTAVWAAFFSARRLMLPIHNLAEGTRAVAEGNYATRLPASGRDELGFVVRSFNEMTRRLRHARDQARISRLQVEGQRAYLEAVLERISTGVLTIDSEGTLYTANNAASRILGIALVPHTGRRLADIAEDHPPLGQFLSAVLPRIQQGTSDWREEFELPGRAGTPQDRQIIICRGASLPDRQELAGGWVVVFDDVSAMVRAQREAAWAEVARRLAHEIKNPLTPIQLSAERLRHKLLAELPAAEAEVLDRSTWTIIQQVDALKGMVRAFADYASSPGADFTSVDLNALVAEVADMYNDNAHNCRVELDLAPDLPVMQADRSRLRQVLHNLIKNGLEAQSGQDERVVEMITRGPAATGAEHIELEVRDHGGGIRDQLLDRLFEPYTSGKSSGSGLGLAIVKKIVEEHGGQVQAVNMAGGGASIQLQLPLSTTGSGNRDGGEEGS